MNRKDENNLILRPVLNVAESTLHFTTHIQHLTYNGIHHNDVRYLNKIYSLFTLCLLEPRRRLVTTDGFSDKMTFKYFWITEQKTIVFLFLSRKHVRR